MAWRGLHLMQAARLSLADSQICVKQDAGEVRLALEDIAWIVIDTPQATLSSALMSACMDAGIALVFTDERHTPSGLALPFHRHHRQGAIARLQLNAKDGVKKRLWQTIVRRKILNQAASISILDRDHAETLKEIARHVEPGDPENVEARAARFYWGRLFVDFVRDDDDDLRNKMLNYGYAVVRAGVARALVASGFLPAFGLKHDGAANAFNLADDLVEPFRPFVDVLAWKAFSDGTDKNGDLTLEDRRKMAGVLLLNGKMGDGKVSLLVAAEMAAASLSRALESEKPAFLELPELERDS
ncbi:type II CRISPR-associated endonuclease Cas1 [Bradyrhizobium sp.]|uniref:type II CRISPR-associated endonuclease Cas1 n=1 Tax=Bradyrhizobium sp. TaxID=376 RepID=UPI00271C729C|nr:type II CRISPR-associated endonuclease Cas1 [Bradyrhizobium sp.]MDO9298633.1 type II CRISPR-associated endonuclease Cas1 [Bradyrhizobium sp.]